MRGTEKFERYEFFFDEKINGGGKEELGGFVFDYMPEGSKEMLGSDKPCIVLMSDEQECSGEQCHNPFGAIVFKDQDNFELAKLGLEILRQAVSRDKEL